MKTSMKRLRIDTRVRDAAAEPGAGRSCFGSGQMLHAPQRRQRAAYLPQKLLLLPVVGTQKGLQGRADGVGAGTRHGEEDEPVAMRDDHRPAPTVTGVESRPPMAAVRGAP